ncbi:hypothetical protein K437DRAFT_153595 [Tilletiaria anomala UBC 951]|uniref:Uncharacterized protein n=1 Tax=Tilletiaria anomala (strain ATCC 24038 / CBS 436.72 / UBC 951) TaxID=1037660 RepID=A0A066VXU9_TILAU|nr:uncharacterized protein K437DRAFT_153595 [Tilletiaria anomala UBC 951]KDN43330.1 hypothetical protein K437DRAFT_153595 [Tilletiaria anomala UBC 951]
MQFFAFGAKLRLDRPLAVMERKGRGPLAPGVCNLCHEHRMAGVCFRGVVAAGDLDAVVVTFRPFETPFGQHHIVKMIVWPNLLRLRPCFMLAWNLGRKDHDNARHALGTGQRTSNSEIFTRAQWLDAQQVRSCSSFDYSESLVSTQRPHIMSCLSLQGNGAHHQSLVQLLESASVISGQSSQV